MRTGDTFLAVQKLNEDTGDWTTVSPSCSIVHCQSTFVAFPEVNEDAGDCITMSTSLLSLCLAVCSGSDIL